MGYPTSGDGSNLPQHLIGIFTLYVHRTHNLRVRDARHFISNCKFLQDIMGLFGFKEVGVSKEVEKCHFSLPLFIQTSKK